MKKLFLFLFIIICNQSYSTVPTWSGEIAKIIYGNCSSCHHQGGIGPFSLMSYQDALNNAYDISGSIAGQQMPPWTPDPNYKRYVHERLLKQTEIDAIQQWVSNSAPAGDLRFAPPAPTYNNSTQLGIPDLSLRIPNYTVSSNSDVYRNFVLPSGISLSKFVTAIEIIPGNTEIVHHVLVFQDSTNNPISPTSTGGTGSSESKLIFGYTPGATPYFTPVGTGFRLAANTRIILQVHYAPGSLGESDSTRVNFKLSSTPLREIEVNALLNHITSMINGPLSIPANQTKTFNELVPIAGNWTFLYAFPHMHLIGRSITSYGITTSNDTIPFVKIPEWEFHWQDNFVFPNAVKIQSGTVLHANAYYDNTINNPENPSSPPHNVSAGESTLDEMMIVFFAYMPYQAGDENLIIDRRIIPMGSTTFCDGQSVELKTIEGTGYSYQWYKNGGVINGATDFTYSASQSGDYTVYISLGPNNTYSDTINVTVNANPVSVITPAGTTTIPTGGNVTLNATTGAGYSYQWYLNDTAINGATSSNYTTNTAGDYTLEVYNGCYSVSDTVTLIAPAGTYTVTTSSLGNGTTSGGGTFSAGTNVTVNAFPDSGYVFNDWTESGNFVNGSAAYTFSLTMDQNLVASFTPIVNQYVYIYSVANPVGGGTTTNFTYVLLGASFTVTAVANFGYSFINWTDTNNNILSTNPVYTFNANVNITIVANFSPVTGITNPTSFSSIKTYPNPCDGHVTVISEREYNLKIINPLGQILYSKSLEKGESILQLRESGIYLFQFTRDGETINRRIVVE